MERTTLSRFVLILLAAIGVLWLLDRALTIGAYFADIILLFFLAWLVAFILHPIAEWLKQRGKAFPGLCAALIAQEICKGLSFLGIEIDPGKNAACAATAADISAASSETRVLVVPTDEEIMIARETYQEMSHDAHH